MGIASIPDAHFTLIYLIVEKCFKTLKTYMVSVINVIKALFSSSVLFQFWTITYLKIPTICLVQEYLDKVFLTWIRTSLERTEGKIYFENELVAQHVIGCETNASIKQVLFLLNVMFIIVNIKYM